jgi:hypothetical protein
VRLNPAGGYDVDESARGVYVISVTPFDDRGALDLDGVERLVGASSVRESQRPGRL